MKKIALSVAALAVSAGAALAADLPSRKGPPVLPPPPPPPPMWTGFYVGLNAGGTFSNSTSFTTVAAPSFANPALAGSAPSSLMAALSTNAIGNSSSGGFIGGGQIGYNYQFYNNFVLGIEADIQGIAGSSNAANTLGAAGDGTRTYITSGSVRTNIDYLGTVRGRLGWLFTPTLLLYGTGGLAYGGVNLNSTFVSTRDPIAFTTVPFFGGSAFSDTRVGWTAGGGVEWMFMPNWSAKVEYLYYDLGTVTTNSAAVQLNGAGVPFIGVASQTSHRFDGHIVRAGVNYHFNWGAPAPVVAKY